MIQPRQDLAFGKKPPPMPFAAQRTAQNLDGDVLLELPVVAMRAVNRSHAARSQHAVANVGTESGQDGLGRGRQFGGPVLIAGKERFHFRAQRRIAGAGEVQNRRSAINRVVKQVLYQPVMFQGVISIKSWR